MDAGFVVFQVTPDRGGIGHDLQRISQQIDIRLFDRPPVITLILIRDAILPPQNPQRRSNFLPLGRDIAGNYFSGRASRPQRHDRRSVRERIIRHVVCELIRPHDPPDRARPVGIPLHPAQPEISHRFQQRPALGNEPRAVPRHPVIIPHPDRHIRRDMVLERPRQRVGRARFVPRVVTLPGEHRPPVPVARRLAQRARKQPDAVIHHRARDAFVQEQHRRIHPELGVPENMAAVLAVGKPEGRNACRPPLTGIGIHLIERGARKSLRLRVAFDTDVALPELIPQRLVARDQALRALTQTIDHETLRLIPRVGEIRPRHQAAQNVEAQRGPRPQ